MILRHGYLPVKVPQGEREAGQVAVELARFDGQGRVRANSIRAVTGHVRIMEDNMPVSTLIHSGGVVEKHRLICHVENADVVRCL